MRLKTILPIIVLLCLVSNVGSVLDNNKWAVWTFDTGDGMAADFGGWTWSNNGISNINGKDGNSTLCVASESDYATTTNTSIPANFTINLWVNTTSDVSGRIFDKYGDVGQKTMMLIHQASPEIRFYYSTDGSNDNFIDIGDFDTGKWYMITIRYNDSASNGIDIFVNGSHVDNDAATIFSGSNIWALCYDDFGGSTFYDGAIDELVIWNEVKSDLDISDLWNAGEGTFYPYVGDIVGPEITFVYPLNSTGYNDYTGYINITTDENATCFLNDTRWPINSADNTTNTYIFYNSSSFTDNTYSVQANCTDGSANSATQTVNWQIDTVTPIIAINAPFSTNLATFYGNMNLTASINISDSASVLYGLNITIDSNITVFNITSINDTTYNYSLVLNPKDYNIGYGSHILNVKASDSHTAKEIKKYNYVVHPLTKAIRYNFGKDYIEIKPFKKGPFTQFSTAKLKDRYTFEIKRDASSKLLYGNSMQFEVTSSGTLDIIEGSSYPAHIVSNELNKWIDFSTNTSAAVKATRINDRKIIVDVEAAGDTIKFNSLGELNRRVNNYTFYYGNFTETYAMDVLETDTALFTLNFTSNSTFVDDIDVSFFYNTTSYPITKTNNIDHFYFNASVILSSVNKNSTNTSFYWNWNVTNAGTGNNITNVTDTKNQSVYQMIATNCSNDVILTAKALNFTAKSRINNIDINVTPEAEVTLWNRSDNVRNYGLMWSNSSNFALCIYPSWVSLNSDYTLVYSGFGDVNNRIVSDATLNNNTQDITLYLFETGDDVRITIVDEFDDPVVNVSVEAHVYDISDNNYTLVATETTDPDGLSVMRLYRDGEDEYKFLINRGTTLLHETARFKLYNTEYTFRVVLGATIQSIPIKLQSLDYTFTRNKTTRNFSLTWNDVSGLIDDISLNISKTNITEYTYLNSELSTSDSGTLNYVVPTTNNGVYIGSVYVKSTDDGNYYPLQSLTLDLRSEYDIFSTDALVMAFFFIGTMAFIGLGSAINAAETSLILSFVGLIIFYLLGFVEIALSSLVGVIVSGIIVLTRIKRR